MIVLRVPSRVLAVLVHWTGPAVAARQLPASLRLCARSTPGLPGHRPFGVGRAAGVRRGFAPAGISGAVSRVACRHADPAPMARHFESRERPRSTTWCRGPRCFAPPAGLSVRGATPLLLGSDRPPAERLSRGLPRQGGRIAAASPPMPTAVFRRHWRGGSARPARTHCFCPRCRIRQLATGRAWLHLPRMT